MGSPRYGGGAVQAVFSPNGRKFALAHSAQSVTVFDFDRCTGLLSNPYDIRLWPPVVSGRGLAISPSSRYLYVSNIVDLYQYDLYAADISLSVLHIDTYDGFMSPLQTTFYQQKLAPDGKIYMTANNGVDVLHVIHQPDSAGVACQFEQHGFQLPRTFGFSIPNSPWFRLYDQQGSPCDTLGIDLSPEEPPIPTDLKRVMVRVYPNPTAGQAQVVLSGALDVPLAFRLVNAAGIHVLHQTLEPGRAEYPLHLEHLPAGIYFWTATSGSKFSARGKLVLVRQ